MLNAILGLDFLGVTLFRPHACYDNVDVACAAPCSVELRLAADDAEGNSEPEGAGTARSVTGEGPGRGDCLHGEEHGSGRTKSWQRRKGGGGEHKYITPIIYGLM